MARRASDRPVSLRERVSQWVKDLSPLRIPDADLDDRDPDHIRKNLPGLSMLASFYLRAEVRGLAAVAFPVKFRDSHGNWGAPTQVRLDTGARADACPSRDPL